MQRSSFLKFLSIPAALGLGTALVIACSDAGPTSPDQSQVTAVFKKGGKKTAGRPEVIDDREGACRQGYNISPDTNLEAYDLNNNDLVCRLQV